MNKRLKILLAILGVLVVLVWASTKLVYAHKLPFGTSLFLSKIYHLKAGEVVGKDKTDSLYLSDYLRSYQSLEKYLANFPDQPDVDLNDLAWQGVVRENWVKNLAENFDLNVSDQELEDYISTTFDVNELDKLSDFAKENYNLSLDDFKNTIVKAYILEMKVYQRLLENYNDQEGIAKAQDAYGELESGEKFDLVAEKYSAVPVSAENTVWVKETDLVGIYEPILDLQKGEFSKIVIIPEAYVIWQVSDLIVDENSEKAWQVKSIIINAKTMDQFFDQYFTIAKINKFY